VEYFGAEGETNKALEEVGEATDGSYANDKRNNREAFPPCGVSELAMVLVLNRAEQQLTNNAEDVNRSDNDRAASNDGKYAVEHIGMFE
jgi:hypothetical protein